MTRGAAQGSCANRESLLTPFPGLPGSASHSRLVQRLRRRYEDELPLLPPGALFSQVIGQAVSPTRVLIDVQPPINLA